MLTDPVERLIINKERLGGYYRLSAYFFARFSVDFPLFLVLPTVIGVILFSTSGLNSDILTNVYILLVFYLMVGVASVSLYKVYKKV